MSLPDDFIDKKVLDEVLDCLKQYNKKPFTFDFLDRFDIHYDPRATIDDLHALIRVAIHRKSKPPYLKDLVEVLDHLKMWGRQHVFLFRLHEKHHEYLEILRDPVFIKRQLKIIKATNRFNRNLFIWSSKLPVLAEVRHCYDFEAGGQIFLKWVETRDYFVTIIDKGGGRRQILKQERSASFVFINLANGQAEFRIQGLQNLSQEELKNQYYSYQAEMNKIIRFDLFSTVPLQSVVRLFLTKPMLPVTTWHMEYIGKKNVNGNGDPSVFSKVALPFQNFLGREITLAWRCKQIAHNRPLVFTLNGVNDEIRFGGITDKLRVDFICDRVRGLVEDVIEIRELKNLAKKYPEYRRILSSIDFYFRKLKKLEIKRGELMERLWFSPETIKKVLKLIVAEYPKKFCFLDSQKEILGIRNRFSLRGGLREYMKRGADKKKHKTILKAMVTPTLSFLYILLIVFREEWGDWIREQIWNSITTEIPFIYFKIFIFVFLAVLFIGGRTIFKKIPEAAIKLLFKVTFNFNPDRLSQKMKKEYQEQEIVKRMDRITKIKKKKSESDFS